MSALHNWAVQWCTDNLPGWLSWQVIEPLDEDAVIELVLGTGGLRRGLLINPGDQDGLGPRLATECQAYITELRDRCDAWLLRQAVRSTMPVPESE